MQPLQIRFEQGRCHWLVLEGRPPWRREQLAPLPLRMMSEQEVPGLLRLEVDELDGACALKYALDGTRMLHQRLRAEPWTMEESLAALCRLSETLEDSRLYMLEPEQFVLEDETIFVGDDSRDLRLVYLPLAAAGRAELPAALERLIVRWTMYARDLDGALLQQLLQLVHAASFSPRLLRDFLRRRLGGVAEPAAAATDRPHVAGMIGGSAAPPAYPPLPASPAEAGAAALPAEREMPPGWKRPPAERSFPGEGGDVDRPAEEGPPLSALAEMAEEDPGEPAERRRRDRLLLIAGALVATAAGWRFLYLDHPGRRGLALASALTLLAAGAVVWLWRGRRAGKQTPADRADADLFGQARAAGDGERMEREAAEGSTSGESAYADRSAPADDPWTESEAASGRPYTVDLPAGTEDRTVFLPREPQAASGSGGRYGLEWRSGRADGPIPLGAEPLVIGRSAGAAQHLDPTAGVSRAHLELIPAGDGWLAKDLGSRNGSWLNGRPMVAYEAYPLKEGDVLRLASSEYKFTRMAGAAG